MKPAACLALLLALAGCGSIDPDAAFTNPGCRAAVYDDADVRTKLKETSSPNAGAPTFQALARAKTAAYDKCMGQIAGQARRGGVQRVQ